MQVIVLLALLLGILVAACVFGIVTKNFLLSLVALPLVCLYVAAVLKEWRYIPLRERSFYLCKLNRYQEAIAACDRFLGHLPGSGFTWFNRGLLLFELKRDREAIASYDKALECARRYYKGFPYRVWYHRGLALHRLGHYEQAIANYDESLKYTKTYHRNLRYKVWYYRGLALQELELYREAISSYDRAMKYMHRYKRGWQQNRENEVEIAEPQDLWYPLDNLWCDCLDKLQSVRLRYEKAIASHNPGSKYKPDFGDAFYNRACCFAAAGDTDLALANLQQAIYLNPSEYREKAKADAGWDEFRRDRQFQRLVVG